MSETYHPPLGTWIDSGRAAAEQFGMSEIDLYRDRLGELEAAEALFRARDHLVAICETLDESGWVPIAHGDFDRVVNDLYTARQGIGN